MAVNTFNDAGHLARFIREWDATRTRSVSWTLVVADDGSSDDTKTFLENLTIEGVTLHIIRNHMAGKAQQLNTILYYLQSQAFDACFIADPHISFIREGWDLDYHETLVRTGYGMLCFYDRRWNPSRNLPRPMVMGNLAGYCHPEDVQDFFFTLTPEAIAAIGYFDTFHLGTYGLERVDYIWRGCRAGFNALHTPFDILKSNDYLKILKPFDFHYSQSYISRLPSDPTVRRHAWNIIRMPRVYFPRNEIMNLEGKAALEARLVRELRLKKEEARKIKNDPAGDYFIETGHSTSITDELLAGSLRKSGYKYADTGKTYNKGFPGFIEKTIKKTYNLMIRFRLRPMVRLFDKTAGAFLRVGIFMKNIDK